jgi:hypothetical protein
MHGAERESVILRDPVWRRVRSVLIIGGLVAFVLLGVAAWTQHARADRQQGAINRLSTGLDGVRSQVQQLGATPVAPPAASIVSKSAPPTTPAVDEPSYDEVYAAVREYLTEHPPAAGATPTTAEIRGIVAAYFKSNPAPSGAPGSPGAQGIAGPTGPQGPGPTDEQIADAVAAYLAAHPAPSGPAGPSGSPGPACSSGYTPTDTTINSTPAEVCMSGAATTSPSNS